MLYLSLFFEEEIKKKKKVNTLFLWLRKKPTCEMGEDKFVVRVIGIIRGKT
jgi:hypothetical protein